VTDVVTVPVPPFKVVILEVVTFSVVIVAFDIFVDPLEYDTFVNVTSIKLICA
jgi:hypothetical protein